MTAAMRPTILSRLGDFLDLAGIRLDPSRLAEATPHLAEGLTAQEIIRTLRNLGLPTHVMEGVRQDRITAADCPCLFLPERGGPQIIDDIYGERARFVGPDGASEWRTAMSRRGVLIRIEITSPGSPDPAPPRLRDIVLAFRGTLGLLVAVSFFISLLGFAAPLLVMVVYDRLIPTAAVELLIALVLGIGTVLLADVALRTIRARAMAWMGSRMERRMGLALFCKLGAMSVDRVQGVPVDQQLARLKQFEGLRGIFTGPLLTTLLELPFVLMFFAAIWYLDPQIGMLILGLVVVFGLVAVVIVPVQLRRNAASASAREGLAALMTESATQQRAIQRLGAGAVWTSRCDAAMMASARLARDARQIQLLSQTLGQSLLLAAGFGAVYLGTASALTGQLTFGALIALIALTWKVLAPVQTLYLAASQVIGYGRSARQIGAFLGMPEERRIGPARRVSRRFNGKLRLEGVTYRYPGQAESAVSGASVAIAEGEVVVVCGRNGVGKSTLLKLLCGFYAPQAGAILIDGIDYRQIAIDELRDSINYLPQNAEFFHGSVLQNFRLAAPAATVGEIREALDRMGLAGIVAQLPEGLETRLSEELRRMLPAGTLQAMSVARALLRDRSVYLLDEPCSGIGAEQEAAFLEHVARLRGQSTVVMVSDRPSHFSRADRLVFLDRGRVVLNDTGPEALRKVKALYATMQKV